MRKVLDSDDDEDTAPPLPPPPEVVVEMKDCRAREGLGVEETKCTVINLN